MTPDHTSLSSISPPSLIITVQNADGSSLSIAGQGTLLSPSFHVPVVSYVPKLTLSLLASSLIMVVVGSLILTLVAFKTASRVSWLILALIDVILSVFGSLTSFVFLPLLLPVLLVLLHLRHAHLLLLSGIIVWDISVAQVTAA